MGSCGNDGVRSDSKWRLLRQGEVSPSKVLVALFMREVYLSSGDLRKLAPQPDERLISPQTLLLIYKLITSNDVTSFGELKALLEDPEHKVRPEVLKRFFRIVNNLEPGNSYFLYELAYSVISIESSHTIILKKKIGKNSPFGKFLRNVYMNIRRMSYPQVHFLYSQITHFLNVKRKKSIDESNNLPSTSKTPENQKVGNKLKEIHQDKICRKFRGLDVFQKLSDLMQDEKNTAEKQGVGVDIFNQYVVEYRRTLGNLTPDDDKKHLQSLTDKKVRVEKAIENTKSLRDLWKPKETHGKSVSNFGTSDKVEIGSSIFSKSKRRSATLRRGHLYLTPRLSPRSPRKTRGNKLVTCQEFLIVDEGEEGYFPSDEETDSQGISTSTPKSPIKSPTKSPRGKRKFSGLEIKIPAVVTPSSSTLQPTKEVNKFVSKETMPSKRWECVKGWSRRQIERVIKRLASQLYHSNCPLPNPQEISEFVEAVLKNPSAQVLFPQLHFLEYLNGLRVKDVNRCAESLRTSFDIRIKPNTSELNKGTPYAAYNFALFYNLMGYKDDAMSNLEEAFRAGHASGDATCLHHCHNLWSSFHGKPYTDAIVTVTKEVDNNMAYLHSINVIANAFDYHYQGLPTEEVLYTLWHYNADCDLEEMEALLLSSLCSFFTIFGWHEMIPFPSQMILYTNLKWPTKAYAFALCTLSQCLLFHGDVKIPVSIMEYGHEIFRTDASPAGQLFEVQYAIFQALFSYLSYRPVNKDIISTISAFNSLEAIYWQAYNMMIGCDWEEAGILLNNLWLSLEKADISYEINDMKIRCLLMQAELDCLCKCSAGALNYISEALELAHSICSDVYITLTLSHIASIQCELGLLKTGSRAMEKDMRAAIRCSSPWLKARLNVVNVKLSMRLQKTISKGNLGPLMDKLDWAEELYSKWSNNYRLKEVLHLKAELLDRSEEVSENGNAFRKRILSLDSALPWSASTCLI